MYNNGSRKKRVVETNQILYLMRIWSQIRKILDPFLLNTYLKKRIVNYFYNKILEYTSFFASNILKISRQKIDCTSCANLSDLPEIQQANILNNIKDYGEELNIKRKVKIPSRVNAQSQRNLNENLMIINSLSLSSNKQN